MPISIWFAVFMTSLAFWTNAEITDWRTGHRAKGTLLQRCAVVIALALLTSLVAGAVLELTWLFTVVRQ